MKAAQLQADFTEYSRSLRNLSTRLVCCGCGEGCSVVDIDCRRDGTPTVFGEGDFPHFTLLPPRHGHQRVICKRCIKPLRKGERPPHAYHFPPPDPWLAALYPAES